MILAEMKAIGVTGRVRDSRCTSFESRVFGFGVEG